MYNKVYFVDSHSHFDSHSDSHSQSKSKDLDVIQQVLKQLLRHYAPKSKSNANASVKKSQKNSNDGSSNKQDHDANNNCSNSNSKIQNNRTKRRRKRKKQNDKNKNKNKNNECQVCFSKYNSNVNERIVMKGDCNHGIICRECFEQDLKIKIESNDCTPWLRCPAPDCQANVHIDLIIKHVSLKVCQSIKCNFEISIVLPFLF